MSAHVATRSQEYIASQTIRKNFLQRKRTLSGSAAVLAECAYARQLRTYDRIGAIFHLLSKLIDLRNRIISRIGHRSQHGRLRPCPY